MSRAPRSIPSSVVAVTGGARGIGRATAAALVREGAHVAIGDVDVDEAGATATALGPLASAYELDVTDRAAFASFLDRVEQDVGPVDVLVNNAGIMPLGPFVDESDDTARRQIDINLYGVMFGMKEAIPRMLARGGGHLINVASVAGKAGYPGGATYCATKHAVVGLSDAVGAELKGVPIEVSAVCPAVVNTDLASGVSATRGVKISEPEDVAEAIVETIRRPRPEVFVPRSVGPITRAISVLPRPARAAAVRLLRGDQVLAKIDRERRAAYDERLSSWSSAGGDPVGTTTGEGR